MERLSTLSQSPLVRAVDDIDEPLRVVKVVLPEAAKFVLATDVPAVELEVLVLERLHVEANRRNGIDCLI